jgi:putative MATE family efflux protein
MYNMVDTWVVGRFVSNEAYAAVGTAGPIINMLIGFFMGLSSGAGVVISQFYGAKRYDQVQRTVHTAVTMTLVMGVVLTAIGIGATPFLLRFMKTPPMVMPESIAYLRIYFSGAMGMLIYNMGAAVLRAVGDSKRPFCYLVVCAVANTVLDLFFVIVLGMGVQGVALATILSQGISAALILITLLRTRDCIRLELRQLRLHWDMLGKIIRVGIPAAVQMAITAFANIFAQSHINFFGDNCMSGWPTYAKVDQLIFLPMQSIALAATTFVGQNLGSGQVERARKGVNRALGLSLVMTFVAMIPVISFAPRIVYFFNRKPEVVEYGTLLLRWITPFYLVCCFTQIYAGALRGAGNSQAPMVMMLTSFVAFRQAYLFVMSRVWNEVLPIAMAYPAGWILCTVLMTIYYHRYKSRLGEKLLVEDKP